MRATSPRPDGLRARTISTLAASATPPVSTCEASSLTYGSRSWASSQADGRPRRGAAGPASGVARSACSSLTGLRLLVRGALGRQVRRLGPDRLVGGLGDDHPGLPAD